MGIWSDLPCELLQSIAKYTTAVDQLILPAVCAQRGSFLKQNYKCPPPPSNHQQQQQLPWLFLPMENPACVFYSLPDDKFYSIDVPEAYVYKCSGSSQGWLIMCGTTPELFMLNPITRSRIELPPITTYPQVLEYSPSRIGREYRSRHFDDPEQIQSSRYTERFWINKVIIFTGNPSNDDFTVTALYSPYKSLADCRKGDDKWSYNGVDDLDDMIYWKGLLYGVTVGGSLVQCNLNGPDPIVETILLSRIPGLILNHNYLAVLSNGHHLLLVIRFYDLVNYNEKKSQEEDEFNNEDEEEYDDYCEYADCADLGYFKTVSIRVYKLDLQNHRWIRVRSTGDQALFIGNNDTLPARDFPGCKSNHVYFANDQTSEGWTIEDDFGVMDLETSKVEPFEGC